MRILLNVVFCLIVVACASGKENIPNVQVQNADQVARDFLERAPTVNVVHYEPEKLVVFTEDVNEALKNNYTPAMWSQVLAGLLGGAAGGAVLGTVHSSSAKDRGMAILTEASDQMVKSYGLEDPVLTVQKEFLSIVLRGSDGPRIQIETTPFPKDELTDVKAKHGPIMVLDFRTMGWGIFSVSNDDKERNRVVYAARGRIVDLSSGKVSWLGKCNITDSAGNPPATTAELVANGGDLLKKRLNEAAKVCAKSMGEEFLNSDERHEQGARSNQG